MQGHRPDGIEQGAASRGEVSGSPRYGAPVTTGHDKQQGPPQALGASDRGNVSSAQVSSCNKLCFLINLDALAYARGPTL